MIKIPVLSSLNPVFSRVLRFFTKTKLRKILSSILAILIVLTSVRFAFFQPKEVEAAWFNDNWTYRTKITFGNSGAAVNNQKVKFDIDTATLITANKLQSDCGDSRFVDDNGNILRYYLDSSGGACNTSSTDYYVLFPTITSGTNVFYHYYGNPYISNGSEASQFSENTFTPTSGPSSNTEEIAPGPVANWKFDEGYSSSVELPITKNEQQINITNQPYSLYGEMWSYSPSDNSLGIIHWDADRYPGATVYFEVIISVSAGIGGAGLYTTGGSQATYIQTANNQSTYTRQRSGALSLTDDTDYTLRLISPWTNQTTYVKSARLIIIQTNSTKITDTETQIEVGNTEKQTSNTATQLTDKKIWSYDSSKYSPSPTAYFEADLRSSPPTVEQQVNIIDQAYSLYGETVTYSPTDNSLGVIHWDADRYPGATVYFEVIMAVSAGYGRAALYTTGGSQVTYLETVNNQSNYTRQRSGALSLTDETDYTVRVISPWSNQTTYIKAARLIIIQTNATKITDTQTQIEVGNSQNNFADTSYTILTDHKIYYYDSSKFSGTLNAYFTASLHTDSGSDTVYAQLLECTSTNDCSTGSVVSGSQVSHTGNTNWTLPTPVAVTLTTTKNYAVQVKVSAGTGDIANAKILLDQTDAGGITALETVQQQVNTLATDASTTYDSDFEYLNYYNPDLRTTQQSFAGGTFTYNFEATMKVSAGTGGVQLKNDSSGSAISGSEVTSTSISYERKRTASAITANLPQYPQAGVGKNLDSQAKNSGGTTSVANSWVIVGVTNLATSGVTAYADLYDTTSGQVSGSEVSTTNGTWTRARSSALTVTSGHDFVIRLRSSNNNVAIYLSNAKIVLDQTDSSGIKAVETVLQFANTYDTETATSYTDADFLNNINPANNHYIANYNQAAAYFEADVKTSASTGYAQIRIDGSSAISSSEVTTPETIDYDRVRSGNIMANLPTSASTLDLQLKASSSQTTSVSNAWLIIQNNNTLPTGVHDSTNNQLHGNLVNTPTWKTGADCHTGNCLSFDGTDDYIKVADSSKLDFAASDSFTIGLWFKHIPKTSGTDVLLAKYLSTTGTDGGYKIQMESDGDITAGIDDDATWGPDASVTSTAATYDDNSWHQLSMVKDGTSNLYLYIDGLLVGSTSISSVGTLANTDHLYLGIDGNGSSNPFKGMLDEIKVYPYARSDAEIKTDFVQNSSSHGVSASFSDTDSNLANGLAGYWKMDEASGDALDSSGNSVTLTDQSTVSRAAGKFGNSADFVPASTDYYSTATDINSIQTISFWTYPDSVTANYFISFSDNIYVSVSSGTLAANGFGGTFYVNGTPTTTLAVSTWQLVTVTTTSAINAADTYAGRVGTTANYSDGKLDEVRIYNRALSPAEVSQLYTWAPGPVGYWKMDEGSGTTVSDSSGNGNSGTITPGTGSFTTGKFGHAYNFDNANTLINAASGATLDNLPATAGVTLEAWIYPVSQGESSAGIIMAKNVGTTPSAGWLLKFAGTNALTFTVDGSTDLVRTTSNSVVAANAWNYVTATWDGVITTASSVHIYVNGVEVTYATTTNGASRVDDGTSTFYIGNDSTQAATFDGKIDDVKIYNYARTSSQIVEDMNAGHPAPGSPVGSSILNLKLDSGYGDTAYDSSPQANNGNLAGSDSCPVDGKCPSWSSSGKYNMALLFDGTNDYLTLGDPADGVYDFGSTSDFTLAAWIKTAGDSEYQAIFEKRDSAGNNQGYLMSISTNGLVDVFIMDSSLNEQEVFSSSVVDDDNWHHVVATFDRDDQLTVYVDGKPENTGSLTAIGSVSNSGSLNIGDGNINVFASIHKEFKGHLDELIIFGEVLTAEQVKVLYNQGKAAVFGAVSTESDNSSSFSMERGYCVPGDTGSCSGSVGKWTLDEKTDQTAYDSSGNSNNLTLGSSDGSDSSDPVWKPQGACKIGSCLFLDGSDDFADFGLHKIGPKISGAAGVSLEFWLKLNGIPTAGNTYELFAVTNSTGGALDAKFNEDAKVTFGGRSTSGDSFQNAISNTALQTNTWYHITGAFDYPNDKIKIYINGVLDINQSVTFGSNSYTDSANASVNDMIGNYEGASRYLKGYLDNLIIFNTLRTPAQIAWDYNQGAPLAHWRFDECSGATANDSSGNSFTGTIDPGDTSGNNDSVGTCSSGTSDPTNEMWNTGTTGKRNASLGFDGTNDYVATSNTALITSNSATYTNVSWSAWLKPATSPTSDTLIHKNNEFRLTTDSSAYPQCEIYSGSWQTAAADTSALSASSWSHVLCTYDGANIKLYVNGILKDTQVETDSLTSSSSTALSLARDSAGSGYYDGQLDEAKIWNYALTPQQIKDDYNQGAVKFGP